MGLEIPEASKIPEVEQFIHLHVHTVYSLLDGMCKLKPLIARAKELGMEYLAITDHNHCGGAYAFQKECKKQGMKYILGMEAYMTWDMDIASMSSGERNALCVRDMFRHEKVPFVINLSTKKKDQKPFEYYVELLRKQTEESEGESWKEKLSIKDILAVFTSKQINTILKDNKKLAECHGYDMHQYHLILLAKNQQGWQNLIKLQSIASERCTYNGRFLLDAKLLEEYHEGLVCTTACVGSLFSKLVQRRQLARAEKLVLEFQRIFKEDFYLEIQPLLIPQQITTNEFYYKMYQKYGIQPVATSDVHYILKEDHDDHDTYLCISTGELKKEEDRREFYLKTHKKDPECKGLRPRMKYTNDFWLRSKEEMAEAFVHQEQGSYSFYKDQNDNLFITNGYREFWMKAINNTSLIARGIAQDIQIGSTTPLYPIVKNLPKGFTSDEYLLAEAIEGLEKYAKKMEDQGTPIDYQKYYNKILDEMKVIQSKHYSDYFLGVQEYVNWANSINPETGLPYACTGPSRGSAGASLILFLIGVTKNIDPVKYDLLFERFLNMNRTAPPDIDMDFSYRHRPLVIKHLEDVYGKDHVCHIGTWSQESIYTAIKDFTRVLNYPPSYSDRINKSLQAIAKSAENAKFKFFDSLEDENPEAYKKFKEIEKENAEVLRLARKFEGSLRQWGKHASGVLACPKVITDIVPTRIDQESGYAVSLFTGTELEELGCIKYDCLGLKNIDMIEDTLISIGKTFNDLYETVTMDDKETFEMLCNGKSDAVFQIESDMMKGLIKSIQPTSIEDLSALVAIGRPGPLECGTDKLYAEWKKDPSQIREYLPNISDLLARSHGTIIYQEQLMSISMRACGFNQGQSDSIVRKILGKKKKEQLEMLRRMMIYGMKSGKGPEGWKENPDMPWYDEDGHYGDPIPGAIANGYDKMQFEHFFEEIKGFASYSFNLAHSMAYGYIALLTAYLKAHYPAQYMAAVLSMQTDSEEKEKYIKVCESMGLKIVSPDINHSNAGFTASDNNTIMYGLSSIKGVKDVAEIIEKRPFSSVTDAQERLSSRVFRKNVAENLIKAGAFDHCGEGESNRNKLLNELYTARGRKLEEPIPTEFSRLDCMEYEAETLGASITYAPAWKGKLPGSPVSGNVRFKDIRHHIAKTSGKQMAMLTVIHETMAFDALVFPKQYQKLKHFLNELDHDGRPMIHFIKGRLDKENANKIIIEDIRAQEVFGEESETVDNSGIPVLEINPFEFVS